MNCASDGCAGWASGVRRRSELTSEAPVVDRPAVSMLGLVTGAGSAASAEGESDGTWCAVAAHDVVHMENRFARCRAEGAHGEFFAAAAAPLTRRAPRHRGCGARHSPATHASWTIDHPARPAIGPPSLR